MPPSHINPQYQKIILGKFPPPMVTADILRDPKTAFVERSRRIGSSFDEFLAQEGMLEECETQAVKEILAMPIARATVCGCSIIVSWNFRHIVHFDKIALYNAVNIVEGFSAIRIHTPQEVIVYENQEL